MALKYFVKGEPVWAKMKGYPPWPAKVVDPPSDSKKPIKKKVSYVLFFGTKDYAWILNDNIIPHNESMLIQAQNRKKSTATYLNGINELVCYAKSYKKVKSPKMVKKEIVENNSVPKSKAQVKIFNCVSKKHNRKVLSHTLLKKAKAHHQNKSEPPEPHTSEYKNSNNLIPSRKSFGFIGLGMMGKQIVKNLLETGHRVTVWNRTASQCDKFVDMGANKVRFPADLVLNCDIIFSCVSDIEASKAVLFGENGILSGMETILQLNQPNDKGFVEMTSIDPFTSQIAAEAVLMKKGAYLEASLYGTSKDAENKNLTILAAGNRRLFYECETIFRAIGKNAYYLSCDVGDGTKMSLILSTLSATMCAALAEGMVMVERSNLKKRHFFECLENGPLLKTIIEKAHKMDELAFQKVTALKYAQKDMMMFLRMGDMFSQPMPITSAANELYKNGKLRNYSNEDISAVYKVIKTDFM